VQIEQREVGGKIMIDYFSTEDLRSLLDLLKDQRGDGKTVNILNRFLTQLPPEAALPASPVPLDDRSTEEKEAEEQIYSVKNFSI